MPEAHRAGGFPARRRPAAITAACVLAVVGVAVALHAPLLPWNLRVGDEAYLAYGAQRILDGEVLYRDFDRNYPPGMYWLHAGLFAVLGPDLLLTRITSLVMLCIAAGGVFLVARPHLPRAAAIGAALMMVFLAPPPHKVFVSLAVVAGLAGCKMITRSRPSPRRLLASGMLLGLTGLLRQDVGAYALAIALGTVAAVTRRDGPQAVLRGLSLLGGGAAVVLAPAAAAFAARDALGPALKQLLLAGYRGNAAMDLPIPPLLGPAPWIVGSLFRLPTVAAAAGSVAVVVRLVRGDAGERTMVLAQWSAMALLMHTQFLHRSDLSHLAQAIVPAALIAAWGAGAAWSATGRTRPLARLAGVAIAAWGIAALHFGLGLIRADRAAMCGGGVLDEPRARMILPAPTREVLATVLADVRALTDPGEPIFVTPYEPLIYFLTGRSNPTRFDVLLPGPTATPEIQREVIEILERGSVRLVLVDDRAWDGREDRRFLRYAPRFARYLETRFERHRTIGTWGVYLRKAPAGGPVRE